jgi:predicted amidohydrolase
MLTYLKMGKPTKGGKMKIALLQTNPQENSKKNWEILLGLLKEACLKGAQCVVLPEMFYYMGEGGRWENSHHLEEEDPEGVFAQLAQLAKSHGIWLVGGSHGEKTSSSPATDKRKVYNTCAVWDPEGERAALYRKIHLFHLRDSQGNVLYAESDTQLSGTKQSFFEMKFNDEQSWTCGLNICYDLRFPDQFMRNPKFTPPDLHFLPSAFTYQTGKDHWEILLRARAIENQCYFVGCNQTGTYANGTKRNYGHSMVVDPWGQIIGTLEEEVGVLLVNLEKQSIQSTRSKLQALTDRCPLDAT